MLPKRQVTPLCSTGAQLILQSVQVDCVHIAPEKKLEYLQGEIIGEVAA